MSEWVNKQPFWTNKFLAFENVDNMKQMILKDNGRLFYDLTRGKLILNPLWERKSYRYKFLLRSLLTYPQSFQWLERLSEYPSKEWFLNRQTNLPCKLHRPYLSSAMNSADACGSLIHHYDFLSYRLPNRLCRQLYGIHSHLLAKISVKNGQEFTINIASEDRYSREGELTLFFYNSDMIHLARLTFSIISYDGKPTLFIGGLQGAEAAVPHKTIQNATKACYGLFPKRILFEVAGYFAQRYGIKQIAAVGNKTHVYNNWRYLKKFKCLYANYDHFWLSLGATEDKKRHFHLPMERSRKLIESVASKKRAEYQRRYRLLDDLKQQITRAIE